MAVDVQGMRDVLPQRGQELQATPGKHARHQCPQTPAEQQPKPDQDCHHGQDGNPLDRPQFPATQDVDRNDAGDQRRTHICQEAQAAVQQHRHCRVGRPLGQAGQPEPAHDVAAQVGRREEVVEKEADELEPEHRAAGQCEPLGAQQHVPLRAVRQDSEHERSQGCQEITRPRRRELAADLRQRNAAERPGDQPHADRDLQKREGPILHIRDLRPSR